MKNKTIHLTEYDINYLINVQIPKFVIKGRTEQGNRGPKHSGGAISRILTGNQSPGWDIQMVL